MDTELPVDFRIANRTYCISVRYDWLSSPWREQLSAFLTKQGANKVKRTGSGKEQYLYVSWLDENKSEGEICGIMRAAIDQFINTNRGRL